MNLYLIIFLILAAGAVWEWFRPQYGKYIYWCCWGLAAACLCLRFGQGTDYVTYHGLYETIPVYIDLSQGYICGFYPEIGWRLISAVFKLFHAPFWVFTFALGLVDMLLLHRFLNKYVPLRTAGLFLLYPVLYLVYLVSGLRQGLAICIFLGIAVPFYLEKKWVPYVVSVLITASFHRVGYAWLVLPVVYYLPLYVILVLLGLSIAGGLVLQIGAVEQWITGILPMYHIKQFLLDGEVSLFAVGERLVSAVAILCLYFWKKKKDGQPEQRTTLFLKAYLCGTIFYMLLCGSSYYASRYCVIFKVLECALVVLMISKRDKMMRLGAVFFLGLTLVMGIKNLSALVSEGIYYQKNGVTIWTYPYISVFNPDKMNDYFDYPDRMWKIYQNNVGDQELWRIENRD